MPKLAINNMSPDLHRRLRQSADRHQRSIIAEALSLQDQALPSRSGTNPLPPPFRGRLPLTQEFLDEARTGGRS